MSLRNKFLVFIFSWLILLPQCFAYTQVEPFNRENAEAMQAAEILDIRPLVEHLLVVQKEAGSLSNLPEEALGVKSVILRKILLGVLEVRQACNKVDLELAYTYDVMRKEERHEAFIFELFNIANFAQLSTFYTLEPYVRLHKQFVTSAIFTTTSGSLGTGIATLSKLYGHVAKAKDVSPPPILSGMLDGRPVDTTGMPPLVTKYLDASAPGSNKSRREELFAMWKKFYHIDASNEKNLCGIADKKKASVGLLNRRILLLWSLHTFVQDFDRQLLSLLKMIKSPVIEESDSNFSPAQTSAGVSEVARLLKIQAQIKELISLKNSNVVNRRREELELLVLERSLEGTLEVQVASDKVDEELNYNYHIVLASLLSSRAKALQYTYNLNFLQNGIMGIVAGRLYLSRFSYAGDRQFVIAGGIGTGLTTLSILEMHGFWRKVDTGPNSLAEVLNLHPPVEYRFSPFVSAFLNDPPPGSTNGKSRRELLNDEWKCSKITTINLDHKKNRIALADMPPHKYDTIKLVTNRNVLLHSLKKELELFQVEVLDLLSTTQSNNVLNPSTNTSVKLSGQAEEAAKLLGIDNEVHRLVELKNSGKLSIFDNEALQLQLYIIRKVITAGLELRTTSAKLDQEITIERHALDKLTRERDFVVAATNNANFLQLSILAMIIDGPLEESHSSRNVLYGNRTNIVSGLMVGGFAGLSLLEQKGGFRHGKAEPNMLGQTLGLNAPENEKLPPMLWAYLNSPAPNSAIGLTRREQLIEYWKTAKILSIDIKKQSTVEKVSALGPKHNKWSETIRLITARVTMLFDLRAMIDLLNTGLVDLLQALG